MKRGKLREVHVYNMESEKLIFLRLSPAAARLRHCAVPSQVTELPGTGRAHDRARPGRSRPGATIPSRSPGRWRTVRVRALPCRQCRRCRHKLASEPIKLCQ
jgi:hypothetical protein